MAANKKTRKMLNTSRGMKVISILVVSCMLFALTGCDSKDNSATTETTTQVTEATTTEATTEAPSLTVPDADELPDNAEAQVEQNPTVDPINVDPGEPEDVPDDGYWHEDPAVTAADLQAAAEAELARFAAKVNGTNGAWIITDTHVLRSSDTQYGIYVMVECDFGGIERAIKAEVTGSGEIVVGYWSNGANTANDGSYESFDVGPSSIDSVDLSF